MPTGYTHNVQDGTLTDFSAFVMQCARGMGACIMMRDDPMDAPIPEAFEPSSYYKESLDKAIADWNELKSRTDDELRVMWHKAHVDALAYHAKSTASNHKERSRYEAMLANVEAWQPPSDDHEGLKKFMREQLTESIWFDCHVREAAPVQIPFEQWKQARFDADRRSIEYLRKSWDDEVERTNSRNLWLKQLRESLSS